MIKSLFGMSGGRGDKSPAVGTRRKSTTEAESDSNTNDNDQDEADNPREERRKKRQKQQQGGETENGSAEEGTDGGANEGRGEGESSSKKMETDAANDAKIAPDTPAAKDDKVSVAATPDEEEEPDHPYVGKRVRIINGPGKGTTGKLVSLKSRGWWTLEGVEGVVHSRRCMLLDKVQEDDMIAYYEKRGKKFRGTPVLDKNIKRSNPGRDKRNGGSGGNSTAAPVSLHPVMKEGGAAHRTLRALDSSNHVNSKDTEEEPAPKREPDPKKEKLEAPLLMSDLLDATTEPPTDNIFCDDIERLRASAAAPEPWVLPAVVLEPEGNGIPAALRHLDPTDLLEVFDRKTGKILMRDDRIAVQDITAELRKHPEYEPIVPPREDSDEDSDDNEATGSTSSSTMRRGRSGTNVYVNATVRPQPKRRWNGREVVITAGSYQGREGKIQASLPGGWYLVEGILDDITVVISPDNFKTKRAERQVQQNGSHHATKKSGKESTKAVASLRTTFNEALGATIEAESTVSNTQIEALRDDQHNLERQLVALEGSNVMEPATPHRRRLQKRLDYVKNCIEKAQKDCEIEEASAKLAAASVESAFDDAEEDDASDVILVVEPAKAVTAPPGVTVEVAAAAESAAASVAAAASAAAAAMATQATATEDGKVERKRKLFP